MKKPLIGLTPSHNIENDSIHLGPFCLRAIEMAGGIPVVLPLETEKSDMEQLTEHLDGILFTGGPDPHPFLFGEETLMGCGEISVKRDAMEMALLSLAVERRLPILGICRGIQMINIGLGGDIYQDIPSQAVRKLPIAHRQPPIGYKPTHTVIVKPQTMLASICEDACVPSLKLQVNSTHHQAVRRPAPGLTVCATAPDGIIEGIEKKDYPFLLGVQWHPEYLWETDPAAAGLFRAFIAACSK